MTGRRVAAGLAVLVMLACIATTIAIAVTRDHVLDLPGPDVGLAVTFTTVGAFLLVRGTVRSIAVILCAQGLSSSVATFLGAFAYLAPAHTRLSGAQLWAAWLANFVWLPAVVLLTPLALLFPDGRLRGPRWRWPIRVVTALAAVFVVLSVIARISVSDDRSLREAPSPTGFVTVPQSVMNGLGITLFGGIILCLFVSLGSLITRRRHATGVERAQLASLLYGMTLTLTIIVVGEFLDDRKPVVFAIGILGVVPVAAGIATAVLRYRLYEIDKVVSRTVAYALVLIVLAGVYVGVLAGLVALVPSDYGQVGVAVATLLVSILAVPLTRRVRRMVDRRFNRSRFDAERVAVSFAARLRARPERGDVPTDLLEVVHRTVAPAHAGVWLVPR